MTSLASFNFLTDARWTEDRSAATHLRSPVTLTWVEMKPPVDSMAFAFVDEGCFWRRFGAWCIAAWNLGHCDPTELSAGPPRPDGTGGGWDIGPGPVTSADAVDFIAKGHLGTPCPRPKDGGMCGCDEDDDTPKVCLGRECDCV